MIRSVIRENTPTITGTGQSKVKKKMEVRNPLRK